MLPLAATWWRHCPPTSTPLPRHDPSVAVPDPAPEPLAASVTPVRPDVRVDGAAPGSAARVRDLPGVEAAVMAGSLQVSVPTPDGLVPLDALVVDVRRFRPLHART